MPLARNGQNTLDLRRLGGLLIGRIIEKGPYGRKTQIPRPRGISTILLKVIKERGDQRCIHIFQCQAGWLLAQTLLSKIQQHAERVAVRSNGMRTDLSLAHEPLSKKGLQ
jgi:hypothetical protein